MARKLRLEYPGACYHVINRGNYRPDFLEAGAVLDEAGLEDTQVGWKHYCEYRGFGLMEAEFSSGGCLVI